MIYFDNNATTQVAPEAAAAMLPYLTEFYGNPSSAHAAGRAAREAVEMARKDVAELLGAEDASEIVFTSGGTEGDNWAIRAGLQATSGRDHVIITEVEHEAVRNYAKILEAEGVKVSRLSVGAEGLIDIDELARELSPRTAVVSVMHANNETGVLFPVTEAAEVVKGNSDALFHVDGVNAAGKTAIDLKNTLIDLYSISAHKFHGPKGIGAIYVRRGTQLPPIFAGGGQEGQRRPGTEAVHQIVGLGAAARAAKDLSHMERVKVLRDRMENEILENITNSRLNGTADSARRLPNTSNISFENVNGEAILARLDDLGICVSTGSACASHDHTASPVLAAMGVPYSYAMGSIRFSLGRYNTEEEVETVLDCLPRIISSLRAMAGAA